MNKDNGPPIGISAGDSLEFDLDQMELFPINEAEFLAIQINSIGDLIDVWYTLQASIVQEWSWDENTNSKYLIVNLPNRDTLRLNQGDWVVFDHAGNPTFWHDDEYRAKYNNNNNHQQQQNDEDTNPNV